jgi:hypothetical protein
MIQRIEQLINALKGVRAGQTVAALALLCCTQLPAGASGYLAIRDGNAKPSHALGVPASARAVEDWQVKTLANGSAAEVAVDAQTPDGPAKSTLSFQCSPGKGGTSTITFIVLGAAKMKGFDFDEFEGPDAPAQRRALVTLTAHRPAGDLVIRTACTGYFTVSDEGFAFEVTIMANVRGKVTRLSDALIHGATGISIHIRGLKHPEKNIEATFPATGAAAALTQVMRGCGKH